MVLLHSFIAFYLIPNRSETAILKGLKISQEILHLLV